MTHTVRSRIATSFIVCVLAAGSVFVVAQAADNQSAVPPPTTATHLVISTLQTASRTGSPCTTQAAGEFIELYNPSAEPLTVNHWKVRYLPASGNITSQQELTD